MRPPCAQPLFHFRLAETAPLIGPVRKLVISYVHRQLATNESRRLEIIQQQLLFVTVSSSSRRLHRTTQPKLKIRLKPRRLHNTHVHVRHHHPLACTAN
jgi:hypothetical protein